MLSLFIAGILRGGLLPLHSQFLNISKIAGAFNNNLEHGLLESKPTETVGLNFHFRILLSMLTLCIILVGNTKTVAQFTEQSSLFVGLGVVNYVPSNTFLPGAMLSFYDFNNDGWDDLTMTGIGSNLNTQSPIFLQNNEGTFEKLDIELPGMPLDAPVYALLWCDYDNDGDADMLITRYNGKLELWQNNGAFEFENVAAQAGLSTAPANYSSAAIADYNHDGCLDLYVGKFSPGGGTGPSFENVLYRNNCDGTFTDVTASSGVYLPPNPTMQPVWFDINHDGWEDLFICVDRTPWPNELFLNNGDGTFTRVTETHGVETYMDAMSSTVGDWDNDGDLDLYVTNNPIGTGNSFYINNGEGIFLDGAQDYGVEMLRTCWGAMWLDYNNDRWLDLFVTSVDGDGIHSFVNNHGHALDSTALWPNNNPIEAQPHILAAGDVNNDGYMDFSVLNWFPNNVQLFLNDGGGNHYISVALQGTIANRDGIGTWIHCYAGDIHQVRYTLCGENFFGQNSRKGIFGLGEEATVDSIVLEWNSGTREVYIQPEVNTHHYFIEGTSLTQPFEIAYSGDLLLCPGESTLLDAGAYEGYLWNTGDTTQTILVSESGTYSVEVWNEFGLSVTSFPVEVAVAPLAEITFDKTNVSCAGANDGAIEVTFSNGPVADILWNTGDTVTALEGLGPEVYSFTATDDFGCPVEGSVAIVEPSPLLALGFVTDVLCYGEPSGTAAVNVIGGTPPYDPDWLGENPEALFAGSYVVTVSDMNGCNIDIAYEIEQPDSLGLVVLVEHASNGAENGSASVNISGGTPPYSISWSTGDMQTESIANLAPGNYTVSVTDGNNCTADTTFAIDTNTGIDTDIETDQPVLYPNPNTGEFRIAHCPAPLVKIEVIDPVGRTIIPVHTISCGSPVLFNDLSSGQYSVVLHHNNSRYFLRLVVVE